MSPTPTDDGRVTAPVGSSYDDDYQPSQVVQSQRDSGQVAKGLHPQISIEHHLNSDLDSEPGAQHHTLGNGPNNAAPGNHTHPGGGNGVTPKVDWAFASKGGIVVPAGASVTTNLWTPASGDFYAASVFPFALPSWMSFAPGCKVSAGSYFGYCVLAGGFNADTELGEFGFFTTSTGVTEDFFDFETFAPIRKIRTMGASRCYIPFQFILRNAVTTSFNFYTFSSFTVPQTVSVEFRLNRLSDAI